MRLLVSTVVVFGVLILSLPALGNEPFAEIAPGSWTYLGLSGLASANLPSVPSLLYPSSGEPILRIEGAMLLQQILLGLVKEANTQETGLPQFAEMSEEAVQGWIKKLVDQYENVTGKEITEETRMALVYLAMELSPELQVLAVREEGEQLEGPQVVTLKAKSTSGAPRFVDVDVLTKEEPEPVEVGPGQPGERLSALVVTAQRYLNLNYNLTQDSSKPVYLPEPIHLGRGQDLQISAGNLVSEMIDIEKLTEDPTWLTWQRLRPEYFSADGEVSIDTPALYILNSESSLVSGLTLGTIWVADQNLVGEDLNLSEDGQVTKSFRGEYRLNPGLAIIGEYTESVQGDPDVDDFAKTEAKNLGAVVKLGDVELGAKIKDVSENFTSLLETPDITPNSLGYELSLKYKDLTVETLYNQEKTETQQKSGAWRLNYSFADVAVLKAGYRFVDVDVVNEVESVYQRENEASLGVDLTLDPNTRIEAGVSFGWPTDDSSLTVFDTKKANAGLVWRLPWEQDLKVRADYEYSVKETSTKVGVGYDLFDRASLLIGYQLINPNSQETEDPNEGSQKEGVASAELSISF